MAKLMIQEEKKVGTIQPEVYGHFSEHLGRGIYEGIFVGEESEIPNTNGMRNDVVNALKEMKVPVLRWPGGCFADEYHWMDGIGPKEKRKKMINTHWGGVTEDNSFGTHEYFELCRQLGCKTYINGNVGSGTVREMSEWMEYMTFNGVSPMAELRKQNGHEEPWKVDYFGVGNESWGCGGNMTPQYYGNLYRRYQTYIRNYNDQSPVKKICCGANIDDYHWTNTVLETTYDHSPEVCHGFMDGLSLHYYVVPNDWEHKGEATQFSKADYYKTLSKAIYIEELINRHGTIMDKYDPEKKIGLMIDEWGCWFDVEKGTNPGFLYQQNTMRDALVAAVTLNIFNKHCDRVKMANIAQMVNVLQSVILTEGNKMVLTPTYYVYKMFREHQGAELLESSMVGTENIGEEEIYKVDNLHESVSINEDGTITITIAHLDLENSKNLTIEFLKKCPEKVEAVTLTGEMQACNTFEESDVVEPVEFSEYSIEKNQIIATLPPCSVTVFRVK